MIVTYDRQNIFIVQATGHTKRGMAARHFFVVIILSLRSTKGFQIEDLGFLIYVRRVNIGLSDLLSAALTPLE
jgi:hypothetical protein